MPDQPTIFIGYCHVDKTWMRLVRRHLRALHWLGKIDLWDDGRIAPGATWQKDIERAIDDASIAILLLSKNSLDSEFIMTKELPRLQRRREEGVRIISLILERCAWRAVEWLAETQAWPRDGVPLSELDRDQIDSELAKLVLEIQALLRPVGPPASHFVSLPPKRIFTARLPSTGEHLFGRTEELRLLDEAWYHLGRHIICLVAFGGVGKTALVAHWLGQMAEDGYRGAERGFVWSFYSQGTSDKATSADQFIDAALRFFGDPDPTRGSPRDRGKRLADLVASRRTLLVLDGLEPLQYPPGSREGQIKDPALATLINSLAMKNQGLCVMTTREKLPEIEHFKDTTAPRVDLEHLSMAAGAELLEALGVKGTEKERNAASEAFAGHPLALTLLGTFLAEVYDGQVERWHRVAPWYRALGWPAVPVLNRRKQGRHARKVMRSYERWMLGRPSWWRRIWKMVKPGKADPQSGERERVWSLLRLMGFFERPARADEIEALLGQPSIDRLNDSIVDLDRETRLVLAADLRHRGLLVRAPDPGDMDSHPLVREYLAEDLRENFPRAWESGHGRLYEHLRDSGRGLPKTSEEMAPYYHAVAHGCLAGHHRKAFEEVYKPLIRQGGAYNTDTLRGFGDDFAALSCFLRSEFKVVSSLEQESSFILGELGFDLRALGRLDDALEAMMAALRWDKRKGHLINAARQADLLSTTLLIRGRVREALEAAEEAVELAAGDDYHRMICLTTRADARHQAGDSLGAGRDFEAAESISHGISSAETWRFLRSFQGCRYCDYLITEGRVDEAKQRLVRTMAWDAEGGYVRPVEIPGTLHALQTEGKLLPLALSHLTYARAFLKDEGDRKRLLREAKLHIDEGIAGIEESATEHLRPKALLVKAEWQCAKGKANKAKETLVTCLEVCRRDKMRLSEAACRIELAILDLEQGGEAGDGARKALKSLKKTCGDRGYGLLEKRIEQI